MGKLKTQAQKDNATSKRLLRTYGITLDEYQEMFEEQGGVCNLCLRPPKNRKLNVDHCHALVRTKISSFRIMPGEWVAKIEELGIERFGSTKTEALRKTRQALKKKSVRSLLCWRCNRGLQYYNDDPKVLEAAATYIRNFNTNVRNNEEPNENS